MSWMTPEWVQAFASLLTLGAAVAALVVAAKAPRLAARFADEYRANSSAAEEKHRLRWAVFTALIRCRSQILHADAIAALNLIDVAFIDASSVRSAFRHFMAASEALPFQPMVVVERYHGIINAMARELGVGDSISLSDVQAGYYPQALGKIDAAALADAEEKIARRATNSSELVN